jgi:small subunit ribosomal protein S20
LANHKSAIKRAKQNEVRRLRNLTYKTRVKKAIKQVRAAISDKSDDQAKESLCKAVSIIQKASSKGVIPRKRASRKISNLASQINQITSA